MEKNLNERINELDYIRGFALLGIILVNIIAMLSIDLPEKQTIDATYQRFLYLFVEGRFYTIFSFLFGVGFYIFLTRANSKGRNGYLLLLSRLFVLFIIGFIHSLFLDGEVLRFYAICGLLVLPFYKLNKHINLGIAIILLIVLSYFGLKITLSLPLILLGLAAGQFGVFEDLSKKIKKLTIFTSVMFVLSGISLLIQYQYIPASPFTNIILMGDGDDTINQSNTFLKIGVANGTIISAFYIGLLLLLLQTKIIKKLLAPLKYYGRMALTNYIGQTILIMICSLLFNLEGKLTYTQTIYVCLAICTIQIVFSMVWLRIFKFGPLEWVWRILTYWKWMPLTKKTT
ncbi:membrane protein [Lysinibacillus sphaericus]|uniref:DUF418 domain-containing protein n=1 Tax=Lysinibacillus sphaericus TaxID=1421 RepID=UPI0018CCCA9E|nr:DUF418 domain-containing protein [Lysinibacillus sphaericus]MBG9455908.1 membrane protein [Lysinibacillus sphaericus]MBG9479673.1 membrane protein [Lysinibacillus sphaericus]MBG9593461.1 membrane protein [Lysinibacillus sphaericus]